MDTLVEYNGGAFNQYFFQFAISLFLKSQPSRAQIISTGLLTQVRLLVARHASRPSQASEQTGTMQGGPPPYDRFERSDMGPLYIHGRK